MLFEFLHKYCVTLNDNVGSQNLFEILKVDTLLSFNVLSMDIKSLLYISFDADILTSLTHEQLI